MGTSSEDLAREAERRQRHARANANIMSLSGEIAQYESARTAVANAKNNCETEKEEWKSTVSRLSSKKIVRTEIFEGEMADGLSEYQQNMVNENNAGIRSAGNLADSLASQLTKIDDKISELQNSISYWKSQLY